MRIDADDIRRKNNIVNVIGGYVEIRKKGASFSGLCPFHDEKTPSFDVDENKQAFYCFGCGAGGDVIEFMKDYHSIDFKTACGMLSGEEIEGTANPIKRQPVKPPKPEHYEQYTPVIPPPESLQAGEWVKILNPNNADEGAKNWKPDFVYPYKTPEGFIIGYVIRTDINGKKITPTVHWCKRPDGSEGWTLYRFDEPRALYNLNEVINHPKAQIVLVEGEKAADAGNQTTAAQNGSIVFTTWSGGTNAIEKADFTPLSGRRCLLLPDNDGGGFAAMYEIAHIISNYGARVEFIIPEASREKGWDIADQVWENGSFIDWAKKNKKTKIPNRFKSLKKPKEKQAKPAPENPEEIKKIIAAHATGFQMDDAPFRILGHAKNFRYFLPNSTRQVVEISPASLSKNILMSLAPLDFWLVKFGDMVNPKTIQWDMAINQLLTLSARVGLFDVHEKLRGRGAWIDEGRPVLHLGQEIIIGGESFKPQEIESRYIYEEAFSMDIRLTEPASDEEAKNLPDILRQLSWENPLSAELLAGWCVIAPICGILEWRPHIWITGTAGSGKSTVLNTIVAKMLGKFAIKFEGKTTEAGIRQQLKTDARPVIYDEAEADDYQSALRLQAVIDLVRVASSGGVIMKGSASGQGVTYCVRSCFCLSSINTSIKHYADESRISQMILKKNTAIGAAKLYEELEKEIQSVFTDEFAERMLTRSIENIDVLQANIKTFTNAAAVVFKSRRIADQVGSMMAGAFLCYSTEKINYDVAVEWLKNKNWSDHTAIDAQTDFERLIGKIATHRIFVSHMGERLNITLGEAIVTASKVNVSDPLLYMSIACNDEIKRYGIRIDHGEGLKDTKVSIANNCEPLRKILVDTPWASSWARVFTEHEKSEKLGVTHFSAGIKARAVRLPVEVFSE